jgi:hypothetical protein
MSRSAVLVTVIMVACSATFAKANAGPMLTISCDKPNGFNIAYGVSFAARVEAEQKNQPEPSPALTGPNKDGYSGKPTFIIDSNRTKMTVVWAELPEDIQLRKQAKELGIPQMPPPPASDATVVGFMEQQISAIEVEPWSIKTYSFFPKMGTAFISQQWMDMGLKDSRQMATFARCEFSWANPRGH